MITISKFNVKLVKESNQRYNLDSKIVNSPNAGYRIFNEVFKPDELTTEIFAIMTLDTKNKVTGVFLVSQGTLNSSIVHARDVYQRAILQNANTIMLMHNHPSGDITPSKEDIDITNRLKEVGKIIGIPVLDHIIIGDSGYYSFMENGGLK